MNVANWQRSGESKAKYPKPIERPGTARTRFGGKSTRTQQQIRAALAARKPRR